MNVIKRRFGTLLATVGIAAGLTTIAAPAATAATAPVTPHFAGGIRWDFNHLRETHGRRAVGADACLRAVAVRDLRATMAAHRPALAESTARSAARCGAATVNVSWVHGANPRAVFHRFWSRPQVRAIVLDPRTRELTVVRGVTRYDRWTLLVTERGVRPATHPAPASTTNKTAIPAAAPVTTVATVREAILSKINAYRASHGLNALTANSCLQGFAQPWADQLIYNYTHNATDPMWLNCGFNFATENLAMDTSASTVMRDWENSYVHNENLLNPNLTSVGIGVWMDAWGNVAAVTDFGGFYPA